MRRVAIIGVGSSKYGIRQDVNIAEITFEAVKPAFEDAGITGKDVEYAVLGSAGPGGWYEESLPAVIAAEYCGLTGAGLVRVEAACATGSAAVSTAYSGIASGQFDLAIAIGLEKMREIDMATTIET